MMNAILSFSDDLQRKEVFRMAIRLSRKSTENSIQPSHQSAKSKLLQPMNDPFD